MCNAPRVEPRAARGSAVRRREGDERGLALEPDAHPRRRATANRRGVGERRSQSEPPRSPAVWCRGGCLQADDRRRRQRYLRRDRRQAAAGAISRWTGGGSVEGCERVTMRRSIAALVVCGSVATLWGATIIGWAQPASPSTPDLQTVLQTYCIGCHNQRLRTAGVAFDTVDLAQPAGNPELWERVIIKLRAGSMPPPGRPRPAPAIYPALASALEADIDRAWASRPRAGRLSAVHRLNRTEYNNAIRDLFALDAAAVDVRPLL